MCGEKTFSRCPYLQCRELPETANLTWKETALSGRARGGRCVPAAILPLPQQESEKPVCISAVEKCVRRKHKPSFPAMVEWSIIKERDKYSV